MRRSARIAFPFAGQVVGGSHISAIRLIQSLDRREFEPLLLLDRDDGPVARLIEAEGLSFELTPRPEYISPRSLLRDAAGSWRVIASLTELIRQRRIDIVHTNDGAMHATWALPTKLAGAKLLWHHRGNPRANGLRFLAGMTADAVVSVSRFAFPAPGLLSAAAKCTVVHSPFDTDAPPVDRAQCRRAMLAELGASADTRVLGFFGNFSARKRPLLFVDTIAEVRRRLPGTPVIGVMFGSSEEAGVEDATRDRIERLGLGDNVRMMGFRRPAEPWLGGCDALVVPAVDEPFGRTLIEAMLLGTPVVATRSGGNPEAIDHERTGLLAARDDAEALAGQIVRLFGCPIPVAQMATAARTEALERYGIERHRASITAIYRRLLGTADGA